VAEELGQARLVLTLDDGPLREGLQDAKRRIEQELGGATASATPRRAAGSSRRGGTSAGGGGQDFNELNEVARRFNLRSVIRALEELNNEFQQIQAGRQLNIGTSWGVALNTLTEISNDLQRLSAGSQLNLNASWTAALNQLSEIDADLRLVSAAEDLNLRSAWTAALRQLEEIDSDLKFIAESKQFNIKSNWQKALAELNDIADAIKRSDLQDEIKEGLRVGQLNTSPVRGGIGFPGSPIAIEKAAEAERKRTRELERARQALERQTAAERRQRQQQEKAGRERLTGALSNAIIGGAFPLLFGQGVGAAAGGGLGGAAGGLLGGQFGFGLSLVGTALGTAFDTALQKAQSLAQGLDDPIKNFDALKEASLLSSKALEKQVDILIASGRATEAEILLRRDLNALFGDPTGAQEYLNAVDELNRAWSQSTVLLASFVAGPLADLLTRLREALQTEVQLTKQERAGIARQAEQVVEGQTGPLQRTAFSSPVSINFRGQTLTGYANEVRETIARTLERDLVARKTSARAAEAAVKTETQLAAVRTAADQALKASGKAIVERALGFDRLAVATDLRQVRSQQNAIIPGFTGLNAQQQQEAASTLSVERLKEIDGLRIKEFQTLVKLQKLDKERAQRNIDLSRSIADTNALLNTQPGIYRDTLKQVQGFSTAILDAARAQDTGLSGLRLLREQLGKPTAANEGDRKRILSEQRTVTQEFVDAAGKVRLSLLEASESLRDNLRNAVLNFTKVRSDPAGLNQFLSPNRRRLRAEQDTATLLPLFRQAQQQFFELTGQRAPEFRGPRQGVNEAMQKLIDIVAKEREVTLALQNAKTAQDLLKTNQNLLEANIQLALATAKLAEKQWLVDVNVVNQAGGASTVNAVTSLAS
jgi:hypothetical protein